MYGQKADGYSLEVFYVTPVTEQPGLSDFKKKNELPKADVKKKKK